MTLIDGDRIVTAQLYDDEHEEFTEKKMSIIDYVNAYTDEGVTEADVVEPPKWISVSERLPDFNDIVLASTDSDYDELRVILTVYNAEEFWFNGKIKAWMPLPEPYTAESEDKYA